VGIRGKDEPELVSIIMLRDTLGPNARPGAPDILKAGTIHSVPEAFARFCDWKKKARYATAEDEKAAKKTGPITAEDFAGKKATR